MLVKILIAFIVIVLVVLVVVAWQPATFRIARSVTISAPPERVFAEVNDLHKWEAWSPWLKADPAAKTAYEGAPAGAGAAFRWSGNKDVGEDRWPNAVPMTARATAKTPAGKLSRGHMTRLHDWH